MGKSFFFLKKTLKDVIVFEDRGKALGHFLKSVERPIFFLPQIFGTGIFFWPKLSFFQAFDLSFFLIFLFQIRFKGAKKKKKKKNPLNFFQLFSNFLLPGGEKLFYFFFIHYRIKKNFLFVSIDWNTNKEKAPKKTKRKGLCKKGPLNQKKKVFTLSRTFFLPPLEKFKEGGPGRDLYKRNFFFFKKSGTKKNYLEKKKPFFQRGKKKFSDPWGNLVLYCLKGFSGLLWLKNFFPK